MGNHGTKTTPGASCISTMRIRGAAPHGVWMTVLKTERMIGFEVVGSNHRVQAVHLWEPEHGTMLDPTGGSK